MMLNSVSWVALIDFIMQVKMENIYVKNVKLKTVYSVIMIQNYVIGVIKIFLIMKENHAKKLVYIQTDIRCSFVNAINVK